MEMSFCHLGFARPVVLLPKAQMLVTTVFPEYKCKGPAKGGAKGSGGLWEAVGGGNKSTSQRENNPIRCLCIYAGTCAAVLEGGGVATCPWAWGLCSALTKQMQKQTKAPLASSGERKHKQANYLPLKLPGSLA